MGLSGDVFDGHEWLLMKKIPVLPVDCGLADPIHPAH